MKKLIFLLLLAFPSLIALGQQAPPSVPPNVTIERVDLSGLDDTKLSSELRADIQRLVGQTYNAQTIEALTQDIQVELPEFIAAATTQPGSQPDRIRVVLLVAKISDDDALKANINSRYVVDAIQFEGMKVRISDELNAELQMMVGGNVNSAQLGSLGDRIGNENAGLNAIVTWKLQRSSQPQHVNVVYDVRKARNTLGVSLAGGAYHSRQGFSSPLFKVSYTYTPAGTLSFWMINSADELIERYAGYGVGYGMGNQTLRFELKYSSYRTQWKTNTLEADQQSNQSPGLYRLHDTLSGHATFKYPLTARTLLNGSAGLEFGELQMQSPRLGFQKSNAVTGHLESSYSRRSGMQSQIFGGSYDIAAGTGVIDSDFIYARHEAKFDYIYTRQPHTIQFNFLAGRVTGNAPMHARFSIGNSRTLRGWNKYEINPLGGNRVVYGSAGYTYKVITGFYDVGSVWDSEQPRDIRHSVGVRLSKGRCRNRLIPHPDLECFSLTVGFPINGGNARPAFILGMGF
jgi:outer membrane protein assembly factor BamA